MSLPLFLVPELPVAELFVLDGPEGHHAAGVQRLRVGEQLLLGDGRGGLAQATVTVVGKGELTLDVAKRWHEPAPDPRLVVAQGIAKGDRGELAVQAMTEVGVDEILPWAASRSVAQWRDQRGFKARDKWASVAMQAAKQARRAWVPAVGGAPDVSIGQLAPRATLVLHEEATSQLSNVDLPSSGEIVLVVGPEGGISPAELETFEAAGAKPVRLGRNVLRTSTAGVAALSVLATRLGRW